MRTSTGAAIGVIAKSVNVHTTLSVGVVASDIPFHRRGGALVLLSKGHGALDVGITTEDGNYDEDDISAQRVQNS